MTIHFDARLAYELVCQAEAVYSPPHEFNLWALDHADGSDIIPRRSTQIGITYSPKRIVISARGSSQWGDWGENLLAVRWPYRALFPVGRVHLGFQLQTRRIAAEFRKTIAKLRAKYPAAEVYVCGHSLGGALCAFLVRLLDLDQVPVAAVYTFESPRIGDAEFSSWYAEQYGATTFRVVAIRSGRADIVTRIPPSVLGWQHIGRPIMIRDGHFYGESEEEWQAARAKHPVAPLPWWRVASRFAASVGAHLCGPLVDELRVLAEQTT